MRTGAHPPRSHPSHDHDGSAGPVHRLRSLALGGARRVRRRRRRCRPRRPSALPLPCATPRQPGLRCGAARSRRRRTRLHPDRPRGEPGRQRAPAPVRPRRVRRRLRTADALPPRRRPHLLLVPHTVTAGAVLPRPGQPGLPAPRVPGVLEPAPARRVGGRLPHLGSRPAPHLARLPHHGRDHRVLGRHRDARQQRHGHQLRLPQPQTRERLGTRPARPLALVRRGGGRAHPRHVGGWPT
ncbi:hypothetical protein SacazDRAFT_00682 [Saccharomonospora azurea NA-128]|uniref:Uncharacterized protein n=1 Tax=Saccharomonospora azurea NA-128 TaxID=882081 RepID=H8GBA8_9PSEU|nr:hypothetical protein SacazDRAFT_00682 [Saccharomonospora azurea NA-128]